MLREKNSNPTLNTIQTQQKRTLIHERVHPTYNFCTWGETSPQNCTNSTFHTHIFSFSNTIFKLRSQSVTNAVRLQNAEENGFGLKHHPDTAKTSKPNGVGSNRCRSVQPPIPFGKANTNPTSRHSPETAREKTWKPICITIPSLWAGPSGPHYYSLQLSWIDFVFCWTRCARPFVPPIHPFLLNTWYQKPNIKYLISNT